MKARLRTSSCLFRVISRSKMRSTPSVWCFSLGMPLADAAKSLATATGVKGRVEVVPTDTDYTVLIDYAHSPDGVENVLKAVRGFAKGRVVALFGCGGDRDRTKRPKMGKIAADLADFCVVTSDNPRTEEPKAIIDDILEGMKDSARRRCRSLSTARRPSTGRSPMHRRTTSSFSWARVTRPIRK